MAARPEKSFKAVKMTEFWISPRCTSHILSYLNMADMESICQTHPYLELIVHSYLKRGNQLVIDPDCVNRFPTAENNHPYGKYGSLVTNVRFSNEHSFILLPHFTNASKMTLHKQFAIEVISKGWQEDLSHSFKSLQHLIMLDCIIAEDIMANMMSTLRETLISLQLINCFIVCGPFRQKIILEESFSKLQSLTLVQFDLAIKDQRIISPVLQRLKIEPTDTIEWSDYKGLPITSLDLKYCWPRPESEQHEMVRSLKQLEHLQIRKSVDAIHEKDIEVMNLKSVDVHYLEVPKEWNLILNLNEDCLRYLNKFLSLEDCVSLSMTHPRLNGLLSLKSRTYVLDKESLKRRPVHENEMFYMNMGQWVTDLQVKNVSEKDFFEIAPHFTEIFALDLEVSEDISVVNDSKYQIFHELNAKLKKLRLRNVSPQTLENLAELHNIEEFHCCDLMVTPKVLQFLSQNKHHMLKFCVPFVEGLIDEFCAVVGEMRLLKCLVVIRDHREILANGSFPELEELVMYMSDPDKDLANLNVPKMRSLVILNPPLSFGGIIKDRMPRLQKFSVWGQYDPTRIILELCIFGSSELTTLQFSNGANLDIPLTHLLQQCPNLSNITLHADKVFYWNNNPKLPGFLSYENVMHGRRLNYKTGKWFFNLTSDYYYQDSYLFLSGNLMINKSGKRQSYKGKILALLD